MGQPIDKQVIETGVQGKTPLFGRWAMGAMVVLLGFIALGALLAWRTNGVMGSLSFLRGTAADQQKLLVDDTPWKTAQALAALAVTQEELQYAHEAEHLADHEVDQAFATALRKGNLQQRTLTGAAADLQVHVTQLAGMVASDKAALSSATKGSDDEQIAQAQLGLDQDQLNDARGDLARASGDKRDAIQQELTAHEADMKAFDAAEAGAAVGQTAVISANQYRTLEGLIDAYHRQKERYSLLLQAKTSAQRDAAALVVEHNDTENGSKSGVAADGLGTADRVARLKRMGLERQLMSLYDDRIETEGQLADVYGKWSAQVLLQRKIVAHLIVLQLMLLAFIVVVAIVLSALAARLAEHESLDQRRMRTLSWIARLVIQAGALIAALLVMFGPPSRLSTVLGLVTAGLTVALQDFILAFVGWFVLMGRNGIGVGDVVEINAVAGEVVDIGLFRTTLLETGNWTAKGHPTGRRVAFNNKFAISGQFFNFSTAGQWMWDEMTVSVPVGEDIGATIERVEKTVAAETEDDARKAEAEWKRVSQKHGLSQFSAEPAVNLRPTATGVDLIVRYVTRASGRFERRNTLYQRLLDCLHSPKEKA